MKDTSVVWLWLGGGPTHVETFDPKLTAPVEFRSVIPRLIVRTGEYFMQRPKSWVLVAGILMILVIGELDLLTGPDISLSLFYLLPITFVTWRAGKTAGFALSFLSVCVWVFADATEISSLAAIGYWNAAFTGRRNCSN